MNLLNLTLAERVNYSDLDEDFKDELRAAIDYRDRVDTEVLKGEIQESKLCIDEDELSDLEYAYNTKSKTKAQLQDLVDDYRNKLIEIMQTVGYHQEKLKSALSLIEGPVNDDRIRT